MLIQAEMEAELQKKKARAARFNLPVKTTADEVRSAPSAEAVRACRLAMLSSTTLHW